jgi:type II secretory pathway pseudopilin PulG
MRSNKNAERGFTLLEATVVVGIMMVLATLAIVRSFGNLETYKANSAMDTVVSQLRSARQIAISQRRNVQVVISTNAGNQFISYQVLAPPNSNEVPGQVISVPLPPPAQMATEAGVPDTPMGFGTCGGVSPVCIGNVNGGPAFMEFTSTGQFTDITGFNVLSGTIFIGVPNQATTARAVTIMGGTGRVRPYTYIGGTGLPNQVWIE